MPDTRKMDTRSKGGKQIGKKANIHKRAQEIQAPRTDIDEEITITVSQAIKDLRILSETCPICNLKVTEYDDGLLCERCHSWHHRTCLKVSKTEYKELSDSVDEYICPRCLTKTSKDSDTVVEEAKECCFPDHENVSDPSRLKLGSWNSWEVLTKCEETYGVIVKWRRNIFLLPSGAAGKAFIEEMTKVTNNFTAGSAMDYGISDHDPFDDNAITTVAETLKEVQS